MRKAKRADRHENRMAAVLTRAPEAAPAPPADESAYGQFPVVEHRPARCPNCGSAAGHQTIGGRDVIDGKFRLRYHACKCGARFRSRAEIPAADRGAM